MVDIDIALQEAIFQSGCRVAIGDDLFQQNRIFDAIDDDDLVRLVEQVVIGANAVSAQEGIVILERDLDRRAGQVDAIVILRGTGDCLKVRAVPIGLIVELSSGTVSAGFLSP